jgi:hypothetical protein
MTLSAIWRTARGLRLCVYWRFGQTDTPFGPGLTKLSGFDVQAGPFAAPPRRRSPTAQDRCASGNQRTTLTGNAHEPGMAQTIEMEEQHIARACDRARDFAASAAWSGLHVPVRAPPCSESIQIIHFYEIRNKTLGIRGGTECVDALRRSITPPRACCGSHSARETPTR